MPIFIYSQDTGNLFDSGSPANTPFASGFSGFGQFKNDPASQCFQDLGPIPQGTYTISPMADVVLQDGQPLKNALALTPDAANNMCGRTGFFIHGDNKIHPGTASQGCIIIPDLPKRQAIDLAVAKGMDQLEVRPHFG